jgi:ADP-ribosylglycohydrolase
VGLPAEGLSPRRAARLFRGPWRQRLVGPWGLGSDDTEHAVFTAQAFLAHPRDPGAFVRSLAWKLRLWLLALPAGVGLATLRATLRLWVGFSPRRSGVFSAGNGPAMRAPVLGAALCDDEPALGRYVTASTELTHRDPRARTAAMAVALATAAAVRGEAPSIELLERFRELAVPGDQEWPALLEQVAAALRAGEPAAALAARLGLQRGVTGYAYRTVPVALFVWLRHPDDFRTALGAALDLGGDTDTVGAIVGALAGARLGARALPADWLAGFVDWPRSAGLLRELARRIAAAEPGPVRYFWPALLVRNVLFLAIVLAHGTRRLLPPY